MNTQNLWLALLDKVKVITKRRTLGTLEHYPPKLEDYSFWPVLYHKMFQVDDSFVEAIAEFMQEIDFSEISRLDPNELSETILDT